MKNLTFLLMLLAVFSCDKKENSNITVGNKNPFAPKQKTVELDSANIFGMYRITEKDFAIVRNVQFGNPDLPLSADYENFLKKDSIPWLRGKPMMDYEYVDSLKSPDLIRNPRFTKEFLPKMKPEYFVYGTKSGMKCKIKDVVFQSNECGDDFIAYIIEIDTAKTGMPLIASENEIPLSYKGDFKAVSAEIRNFTKKDATETNYGRAENYKPKVFASFGNYFLAYNDDFEGYDWKSEKAKVQFPERLVISKDSKGKLKVFWSDEMDLLGLPCL